MESPMNLLAKTTHDNRGLKVHASVMFSVPFCRSLSLTKYLSEIVHFCVDRQLKLLPGIRNALDGPQRGWELVAFGSEFSCISVTFPAIDFCYYEGLINNVPSPGI